MNRRENAGQGRSADDPARRDDDDLAALFDAQGDTVSIPADLDAGIRAAARAEAARAGVPHVASDVVPPEPFRNHASDPVPPAGVRRDPPRWLAAAAVVMLALVLVPLVRQAPEPREGMSSDPAPERSPAPVAADADTGAATIAGKHPTATGPGATEDVPESEPEPEPAVMTAQRPEVAADTRDSDRSARRSSPTESLSAAASTRSASTRVVDPFAGHRRSPSAWLDRLRALLRTDGLTRELQAEYRRFRSRYPEMAPAFDPAAVAREGEATRR